MRALELKDPRAVLGSGWRAGGCRMGLEPGSDSTQPGGGTCRLAPSWVLPVGNPRSATSIPGTASPAGSGSPDNPPIPPPAWNLPEPRGPPPPIPHATASQPAAHVSPARHHSPVAGSLVWSLTASPPCRKMSSKFSHLCSRLTPPHPGPGPSSELSEPLSGG